MSEDTRAIVAAMLAAASAQTGQPWRKLRDDYEAILKELAPSPGVQRSDPGGPIGAATSRPVESAFDDDHRADGLAG